MNSSPSTPPPPARHFSTQTAWFAAGLAAIVFIVYWPATQCDFTRYDDAKYYVWNEPVQSGLNGSSLVWAFTTGTEFNWHPLTWISHMLDVEFSEHLDPSVPHFTNVLWHAANSVLLFVLLRRLTGAQGRSLFVAGLFALHPINVESVAWIAERKNVLSTFFWLATLLAYERYARAEEQSNPPLDRWRNKKYLQALGLFALGLMSKPMLVTLPFTLLLLDWWPLRRTPDWKRLGLEKWPFFVLSAGSCVVTFLVQQHGKAVQSLDRFPAGIRAENVFVSYLRYLGKTFWPENLAVDYPHPGHWPPALVLAAVALIASVSVAVCWRTARRWLFTGWFWFLGTLVPVIGIVQVGGQSMADRYGYVPLIGIFIMVAWGGQELLSRMKCPRPARWMLAGMVAATCAGLTRHQLGYWQNDGTLFGHSLAATENNAHAHVMYGMYYSEKNGNPTVAREHFLAALAIDPNDLNAHYDLAILLDSLSQPEEAVKEYREALRVDPSFYAAHFNLGMLLNRLGRRAEAITEFQETLKYNPDLLPARQQLEALKE